MLHQNTKGKYHNVWHRDSGIRRGRILSPLLLLFIIDFIIKISVNNPVSGTKWKHDRLTDLDSADDIALLSDARNVSRTWQSYTSRQQRGLRISCGNERPGYEIENKKDLSSLLKVLMDSALRIMSGRLFQASIVYRSTATCLVL